MELSNKAIVLLLLLTLASSMAAAATFAAAEGIAAAEAGDEPATSSTFESNADIDQSTSPLLRRMLGGRSYRSGRPAMTCDRYPKVCHLKGSAGHSCCGKRCVSLRTDNLNCGRCGRRCGYGELCCRGRCVDVFRDRNNCGGCQNKCRKGSYCRYGMCSYAH